MKRMLRSSVCGHEHLKPLLLLGWVFRLSVITVFFAASVQAQFTANIQGTVVDPSGAAIAQAKVDLVNTVTQVSVFTRSTFACAIAAPLGSTTVPWMLAVNCACTEAAKNTVMTESLKTQPRSNNGFKCSCPQTIERSISFIS